jgi:hypothetical protein
MTESQLLRYVTFERVIAPEATIKRNAGKSIISVELLILSRLTLPIPLHRVVNEQVTHYMPCSA